MKPFGQFPKGYFENQAKAKYFFEKRNQELIKQNIEENEIKKINNLKSPEDDTDTETNLNDQTEIISDVNNSENNSKYEWLTPPITDKKLRHYNS